MPTQLVIVTKLRRQLTGLMQVEAHEVLKPPDAVLAFRGQVLGDTETAFEDVTQRFASLGYTAFLRDRPGGGHEVIAAKEEALERKPARVWLNAVLFLAAFLIMLYVGAGNALVEAEIITDLDSLESLTLPLAYLHWGLPFAGTLMGILLAHELSHYFIGRRYNSPLSLPYFIPIPTILGTMGAVIVQRSPMRNRKELFDIGIAGPLGGLIVAIPLLVIGLSLSSVGPPPANLLQDLEILQEGNSLLYLGLKYLVFGRLLPSNGEDVWLHPVAFAAWGGLLVTMINLIPVGQLDGGHISYALLGRRTWSLNHVLIAVMVGWGGWLLAGGNNAGGMWMTWGFLNLVLNRRHPPPLDDATKLGWPRTTLGLLMLAVFVLLFMPAPLRIVSLQ